MSRFWIKLEGCDVDSFSTGNPSYTAIHLPIFGIFPSYDIESGSSISMQGREIAQRRIRRKLQVEFLPNSTWQNGLTATPSTDSILFLLDVVLQKTFVRLNAPDAPKVLPVRWRDSTNFPRTSALMPFIFARNDISTEKNWQSGLETFVLTCYARDLN